ncbi:DNA polymerase I [Metallumcola ferriviriculae]|uniref:DNA polymerase I n=1 Tax=Metallumcola ferriviriculae TaxID=3039180 RepID=A0AAU0UNE3_9FIRM|nr:DNA polymerase I [Desulfitibacteraceae bacterium MK1]
MKRFLVIDGNSLIHRAFYALPPLQNKSGQYTNAVYGFTKMFLKVLAEQQADYVAVCFDKGKITFRHDKFEDYKGTRKATPSELRPQFALVKEVLASLGVTMFELDNYEADDLIGSLACAAEKEGFRTLIVTGDRDALQLASKNTEILLTKRGISELDCYGIATVQEKYGLEPYQLIDVKGLMGDQSDNIPGVPGVGEKTALKLINQFGSLEEVLANIDQVSGKKLKERLTEYQEQAVLSKELATIDCQVPLEMDLEGCCVGAPDYPRVLKLFKELEFASLVKEILARMEKSDRKEGKPQQLGTVTVAKDQRHFKELLNSFDSAKPLALYIEHDAGDNSQIMGLGVSDGHDMLALSFNDESDGSGKELAELIQKVSVITHDAKLVFRTVGLAANVVGDTLLAGYLLNPSLSSHELSQLAVEHLDLALIEEGPEGWGYRAGAIARMEPLLREKLENDGLDKLYLEVELPLAKVLASMEQTGIKVDGQKLEEMGKALHKDIDRLTTEIYQLAGKEFNINSPKQLGVLLFQDLGLPPLKKTKTGYSTSAQVLEELAPKHDIVAKILEYRTIVKLRSTYIEGLKPLINPKSGKIHTTFNQTITSTGRLSSTEPNLQNIPVRLEIGRKIRQAFVPSSSDRVLLAADYSQIELRVLAHISGDNTLMQAFHNGEDIHTRTAAEVFDVSIDAVTREMRRSAKAVNFGIVYGISDFGLAQDLGISRKKAKDYIERYFARYHGVKEWIDRVIVRAREEGFVTTLLNRRRYLPDLLSSNFNVRKFGERTAMNTPIQGSAADIIKLAMLTVDRHLSGVDGVEMLLQVHDELILEVEKEQLISTAQEVKQFMEQAFELNVPLVVDLKSGSDWYQLEPLDLRESNA